MGLDNHARIVVVNLPLFKILNLILKKTKKSLDMHIASSDNGVILEIYYFNTN